jgi:hypothetical protein
MRFTAVILLIVLTAAGAFSLSNEDMRVILDKKTASIGDALYVIYSIDNPDAVMADIYSITNHWIMAMDKGAVLDAGALAVIAIELGKARGGFYYTLTGLSRYAAQSLIYDGIYPESFAWNRSISGSELIELAQVIKAHM